MMKQNRRGFLAAIAAALAGRKLADGAQPKPADDATKMSIRQIRYYAPGADRFLTPGELIARSMDAQMAIRQIRYYDPVAARFITRFDVIYGYRPPEALELIGDDPVADRFIKRFDAIYGYRPPGALEFIGEAIGLRVPPRFAR
jgi:hypothetical protein